MSSLTLARGLSFGDPVIAAVSDEVLEFAIEQAFSRLDLIAWGSQYARAGCLLALHMIASAPASGGGGVGAVTSEAVGQWSRSLSVQAPPIADAWFASTTYGAEYLSIRASRGATRFLAV